ncbi:hypothetical protein BHM03_00020230 [Ensete ventricosum]|nr:hypothetical protein BHM03_00020230 [Ensete ventricosum]
MRILKLFVEAVARRRIFNAVGSFRWGRGGTRHSYLSFPAGILSNNLTIRREKPTISKMDGQNQQMVVERERCGRLAAEVRSGRAQDLVLESRALMFGFATMRRSELAVPSEGIVNLVVARLQFLTTV